MKPCRTPKRRAGSSTWSSRCSITGHFATGEVTILGHLISGIICHPHPQNSSHYYIKTKKLESPGKPLSQPLPHQWSQWHTDRWHWRPLLSSHPLWTSWRAPVGGAAATSCLPCPQPAVCSGSGTAGPLRYLWPAVERDKAELHLAAQGPQSELQFQPSN